MERFRPDTYGESFAEVYDEWYQGVSDAEAVAAFVDARAGAGPVLELGVGTGRLAAPLLARNRAVVGLDASAAMLARCRGRGLEVAGLRLVRADMAALPF
ncbi:MAG: class I SAM-dependent methyltransferase, partial [Acidimicrobiales bacterium]